jgi:hypothetical protein
MIGPTCGWPPRRGSQLRRRSRAAPSGTSPARVGVPAGGLSPGARKASARHGVNHRWGSSDQQVAAVATEGCVILWRKRSHRTTQGMGGSRRGRSVRTGSVLRSPTNLREFHRETYPSLIWPSKNFPSLFDTQLKLHPSFDTAVYLMC